MKRPGIAIHGSHETKLDRFQRLAERRVTEAIRRLRLISNLANRHNYEFTEAHVRQIIDALEAEIKGLKQRFRQEGTPRHSAFSFKE